MAVCVHGTYDGFMSSIWQEGLKRMTRNHVHFATGLPKEDGVISGTFPTTTWTRIQRQIHVIFVQHVFFCPPI
jgi:RNA:NAD 2'-phosphotransferase (TPT1/KptA family)